MSTDSREMQSLQDMDGQLSEVAVKLVDAITGTEAHVEYGTEGRETMGGTMIASMARALVSLQSERRQIRKQLHDTSIADGTKVARQRIEPAPPIPTTEDARA